VPLVTTRASRNSASYELVLEREDSFENALTNGPALAQPPNPNNLMAGCLLRLILKKPSMFLL